MISRIQTVEECDVNRLNYRFDCFLRSANMPRKIIVAAVNTAYLELTANWFCSLLRSDLVRKTLLVGLDPSACSHAAKNGISLPCFYDPCFFGGSGEEIAWRSANWVRVTVAKILPVESLLQRGYSVLFTDTDIVLFRDPFPVLYEDVDLEIQNDHQNSTKADVYMQLNSGLYYARPSALPLLRRWMNASAEDPKTSAQLVLTKMISRERKAGSLVYVPPTKRSGEVVPPPKASFRVLDPVLFPNGGLVFKNRIVKLHNKTVAVHANWMVGMKEKKRALVDAKSWYLAENGKCVE